MTLGGAKTVFQDCEVTPMYACFSRGRCCEAGQRRPPTTHTIKGNIFSTDLISVEFLELHLQLLPRDPDQGCCPQAWHRLNCL
jgi:hypothetical protein